MQTNAGQPAPLFPYQNKVVLTFPVEGSRGISFPLVNWNALQHWGILGLCSKVVYHYHHIIFSNEYNKNQFLSYMQHIKWLRTISIFALSWSEANLGLLLCHYPLFFNTCTHIIPPPFRCCITMVAYVIWRTTFSFKSNDKIYFQKICHTLLQIRRNNTV